MEKYYATIALSWISKILFSFQIKNEEKDEKKDMRKKEIIKVATDYLHETDARKQVILPPQQFTVSDTSGQSKTFKVKGGQKGYLYSINDVEVVLEALLYAVEEGLRHGEPVSIRGFGAIELRYRPPRKAVIGDKTVQVGEKYIPRFKFGNEIRDCAAVYAESVHDRTAGIKSNPNSEYPGWSPDMAKHGIRDKDLTHECGNWIKKKKDDDV